MEGTKFNKGTQGNNRRFFRNRREDNSFNHPFQQESNLSSQGGKVNSVKPRYSSAEHTKHPDMKPGMVVINAKYDDGNKNNNKGNYKGKDDSSHGQHTQKEHRSNVKQDDRRKFNFPKEKGNRNFKPTGRNQSRGNERSGSLPPNDETRSRKQPCKIENGAVVLKRNDNINASMTSTPQHLKPAVHVQPLQQEKTGPDDRPTVEQNPSNLQATASNRCTSSQGNPSAERCQEVSNVGYAKETNTHTSRQAVSEQDSSTVGLREVVASTDRKNSKQAFQKSVLIDQNSLNQINPIFQNEARSLADLNSSTSGLGSYLSSSICSSFVPALQKDLLRPQSNPPSNQTLLQDGCLSPAQLAIAQTQPSDHPKNFLTATEQNLVPLSQDLHPRAVPDNVKEPLIEHSQSSQVFQIPRDQLEEAPSLQSVPDEKYGYRISVDSLFSTSFFTNPQAGVMNKKEMAEIDTRDPLDMAKNNKSNETITLSSQVPRDQLLNEAQQYDVTSLLAYPPSEVNYKNGETFDPRLVSPRHSKGIDKPTLGSPPPVLRNLAPRVSLESQCPTTLMKDIPFSLESTNARTYRNFSDQTEKNIGKEVLPSGKMSAFSREENSKTDMASEKEALNNIPQLSRTQILQEPMAKLSLTKNSTDVQTESLVNLNYREISKQSMSLPPDGFASEAEGTVRCPVTTDKTSLVTKAKLQPTSSDKEVYDKQNDRPLLSADVDGNQAHRGPFPQGPPFLPNPFFNHSLLTHRQAIPSAFVYPSRVGMPGNPSGFTDVAQHTGTNPGTHIFPPHGTTVCLNVGGRIFEILTSTFSPYSESLLYQIFTGATPAPISQRGHIFFDRDGYLFEIILAFARVGHLTLPPNVNLTCLMNEAKFFGMYEYMFQKGQVSSGNIMQFQRTTRCTLHCDDSSKTSETRVFVLQGDDKLKIESLRVSGPCHLYVDLYTPLGIKETSNFVMYTPDKPDLWKAYQFCAERQLVFHLERAHSVNTVKSCNKSSVDIVFVQTFVFIGDDFVPL